MHPDPEGHGGDEKGDSRQGQHPPGTACPYCDKCITRPSRRQGLTVDPMPAWAEAGSGPPVASVDRAALLAISGSSIEPPVVRAGALTPFVDGDPKTERRIRSTDDGRFQSRTSALGGATLRRPPLGLRTAPPGRGPAAIHVGDRRRAVHESNGASRTILAERTGRSASSPSRAMTSRPTVARSPRGNWRFVVKINPGSRSPWASASSRRRKSGTFSVTITRSSAAAAANTSSSDAPSSRRWSGSWTEATSWPRARRCSATVAGNISSRRSLTRRGLTPRRPRRGSLHRRASDRVTRRR